MLRPRLLCYRAVGPSEDEKIEAPADPSQADMLPGRWPSAAPYRSISKQCLPLSTNLFAWFWEASWEFRFQLAYHLARIFLRVCFMPHWGVAIPQQTLCLNPGEDVSFRPRERSDERTGGVRHRSPGSSPGKHGRPADLSVDPQSCRSYRAHPG